MRRVGWLLALAILGGALSAAAADCGCSQGVEPACYVTFRTNESISFSTVFPVDYFTAHSTGETPFALGWMITAADGSMVRSVAFDDVVSWSQDFIWDLTDEDGHDVSPGFYRIVVSTTAGTCGGRRAPRLLLHSLSRVLVVLPLHDVSDRRRAVRDAVRRAVSGARREFDEALLCVHVLDVGRDGEPVAVPLRPAAGCAVSVSHRTAHIAVRRGPLESTLSVA